jgi:PAS domain S-box-containing protein
VIDDILERLSSGETLHNYEARLRSKDGSIRHVLISSNVRWQGEEFLHTRCITRDITDRKRTEAQLQQITEMVQAIIRSSPLPIVAIDPNGFITSWNPAAEKLFGWTSEEVLGQPLPFIPHDKIEEHRAMRARDLQGLSFESREIRRCRKDGSVIGLLVSTAPMRSADDQISGIVSVYADITERQQASEQLRQHADRLALSNAALEQYAYAASHDLQEPLRMVTTYTQLLAKQCQGKLDGQAVEFMNVVLSSAERMRRLISDLLSYSRTIAETEHHSEQVETNEIVDQAIANCQAAIDETNATISHSELPALSGNREQCIQLFQNLIGNAIKYRTPGVAPRIHIRATREGDFVRISVQDNGIGFSMQYADRIFGIFKRLHGPDVPGTGIGLALCKRIAENHGGRAWVESEPGQGSTFYVTLPAWS